MARVMEKDTASRKKTLDTRDRILDAAEDVFYDKGYSNTTLNEIAEAASVTRGAIYWHFKNKEDLFLSLIHISPVRSANPVPSVHRRLP